MSAVTKVLHLIEDETIFFPVKGTPEAFRLRVWREKGCPAVVMASQTEGGKDPARASCKVANYVWRVLLGFTPDGMDYFEVHAGIPYLVEFDAIGNRDRAMLDRPIRTVVQPEEIDALIGTHVEL